MKSCRNTEQDCKHVIVEESFSVDGLHVILVTALFFAFVLYV